MPSQMHIATTNSVTGMARAKERLGIVFGHALLQPAESEAARKQALSRMGSIHCHVVLEKHVEWMSNLTHKTMKNLKMIYQQKEGQRARK